MAPVNESELEWTDVEEDDTRFRRKQLGEAADADRIGCSLYELPAGTKSWPYHYHTANEEAVYVLSGTGSLRLDDEMHALREGDYVSFPADESGGHRIINNSDAPLRYLAISTMQEPDITVYPDMDKFGVFAGSPPGGRDDRTFEGFYDIDDTVDYWEE